MSAEEEWMEDAPTPPNNPTLSNELAQAKPNILHIFDDAQPACGFNRAQHCPTSMPSVGRSGRPKCEKAKDVRVRSKTSGVGWGDDMIVTIHVLDVTARAPYKK